MIYKLLARRRDHSIRPDDTWLVGAMETIVCPNCKILKRSRYPNPVNVVVKELPRGTSCGRLFRGGVGLMRDDLADDLGLADMGFSVGTCYDRNMSVIPGYRTYYYQTHIVLRSLMGSEWRVCPLCSEGVYDHKGQNEVYVVTRTLSERVVYHDTFCNWYVRDTLAEGIDWAQYQDIELFGIPELDEPKDGLVLPGDLPS